MIIELYCTIRTINSTIIVADILFCNWLQTRKEIPITFIISDNDTKENYHVFFLRLGRRRETKYYQNYFTMWQVNVIITRPCRITTLQANFSSYNRKKERRRRTIAV